MMRNTTPAEALAEAFTRVAAANHYLVGVLTRTDDGSETFTLDELGAAEQILITAQNKLIPGDPAHTRYDVALDLVGHERTRRQRRS